MGIEGLAGRHAREKPGHVAITDGSRSIAYGELPGLVRAEARFIAAAGGERHALLARNGCAWVLADLALGELGALNVPLPRNFTAGQLLHAIGEAGIDALVTDEPARLREILPGLEPQGIAPASGLHLFRRRGSMPERVRVPPGTAKVTYTSGSTAEPKGVCLGADAIERTSGALAEAIGPLGIDRHLGLLPLPTLLENIAGVLAPLRLGAACIVPPEEDTGMSYAGVDAGRLAAALARWRPGSLILVPELLRLLLGIVQSGVAMPWLRFVAVGGASVSPALLEEARSAGIPVYEGYGLSECASVVCLNLPGAARAGSVGRPLPHLRVRCDADGEIHVRGAAMLGYLGAGSRHAGGEVATGDLGAIDEDGFVRVRGRARDIFISSYGRNVSPEWIERELAADPAIRLAFVAGEALPHPVALLVPRRRDVEPATLRRAVESANARLPDYARVREWAAVDEAPTQANGLLTANGRIRRGRFRERYAALLDRLSAAPAKKAS